MWGGLDSPEKGVSLCGVDSQVGWTALPNTLPAAQHLKHKGSSCNMDLHMAKKQKVLYVKGGAPQTQCCWQKGGIWIQMRTHRCWFLQTPQH